MSFIGHVHPVRHRPFLPGEVGNKCPLMELRDRNRSNERALRSVRRRTQLKTISPEIVRLLNQSMCAFLFVNFFFPSGYCVFITGISFVFCRPSVSQPTVSHSTAIKKPTSSGALSGTLDKRGPYSYSCHSLLIAHFFLLCVGEGVSLAPTECTVVTFTFGDEPVPYRSRIPGRTVTLKQFKEMCLPKKGNYK